MVTFKKKIIDITVKRLLNGEDYRLEIVNAINADFFDFALDFFKKIALAKITSKNISSDWFFEEFIKNDKVSSDEKIIYAGLNKKTINNVYNSTKKEIVINAVNTNYEYLSQMIYELDEGLEREINIQIKISYNDVDVNLSLGESLLVINILATKKIALRGGAWSSIGKQVEKPLLDALCATLKVPDDHINNKTFIKDKKRDVDREVDYKISNRRDEWYRIEVKLMGKGNPEVADAVIARDSDVFVADTLSQQNRNQLTERGVKYLELKGRPNDKIVSDFKMILDELDIPYENK